MPAKRTIVRDGVYRDQRGRFWIRPWIRGKRTWRKLQAIALRYAIMEAHAKKADHERAKIGLAKDPFLPKGDLFKEMAEIYMRAGCPNNCLEPRPAEFCKTETMRLGFLVGFFGNCSLNEIKIPMVHEYRVWRADKCVRGSGGDRTVDLDLCTLSNVLNYGVSIGRLDFNRIRNGRPRFRKAAAISRSRERAPSSADEVHKMADYFFDSLKSEVNGWLLLFSMMSGCRNVEMRALRVDAKSYDHPGYVQGNCLFIRRAKGGVNPFVLITDEFKEMYDCWQYWHECRYPDSPWYFPGWVKGEPVHKDALRGGMYAACSHFGFGNITPHGLRSFYVTKRRGDGILDSQVAAEIGDKTTSLISQTYGDVPPNWVGQVKLSFKPTIDAPAWLRWRPLEEKISNLTIV